MVGSSNLSHRGWVSNHELAVIVRGASARDVARKRLIEVMVRIHEAGQQHHPRTIDRRVSHPGRQARGVDCFDEIVAQLQRDFGRWQLPWGELNRFQRISPAINPPYSDAAPSIPVPFAEGRYGSLASIRSEPKPGTKRWYGNYGNSFVAVVEFGKRVRARAVTAGGESGHPDSPHFADEIQRYASGDLRDVYFYPDQLEGHTERIYRPGK